MRRYDDMKDYDDTWFDNLIALFWFAAILTAFIIVILVLTGIVK